MNWLKNMSLLALFTALGAGLVACIVGFIMANAAGFLACLFAAGTVISFFVSGQLLQGYAMRLENLGLGMTIILCGMAIRVSLLGLIFWALAHWSALGHMWLVVGALVVLVGWLAGLLIGHSRARIPAYDTPYTPCSADSKR
uniref:hypothetical protein n=1 Tax=Vaginimicrobium propionicum TaxID=1871034 RepID=UPI000970F5DB|nr:hypothetical protein [Vaginimicrobium propionicum]